MRVQQCSRAIYHEIITARKRECMGHVMRLLEHENSSHRGRRDAQYRIESSAATKRTVQ